jgi:hypothetical protein
VRLGLDPRAQGVDPVRRQRVGAEVLVAPRLVEHLLVAEVVEEVGQALAGQLGLLQQGGPALVGAGFLFAAEADGAQGPEVAGAAHQARRRLAGAGHGRQQAQAHGQQEGLHAGRLHLARAGVVAGGQVADFVGDDALQLVGRLGLQDQPGVDPHHPRRGEGVQVLGADDRDLHVAGIDAGGPQDRVGVPVQDLLDLGVADQGLALALGRGQGWPQHQARRQGGGEREAEDRPDGGGHAQTLLKASPARPNL